MHHPVFLLGLGAQKAGTTWLDRALRNSPGFAAGAMKEYHVWDAVCGVDADGPPPQEGRDTLGREALRARLIEQPDAYFDHFAGLLTGAGTTLTADIAPAYAALPADVLAAIRAGFSERGIPAKALFIMRDPVERLWSAARMYRRKGLTIAGLNPLMPEADYVAAYAQTAHAHARGRYERTIESISAAFEPDDVFVTCFESLFLPEKMTALSAFLGVALDQSFAALPVNRSPKQADLPSPVRQGIIREFAQTLAFCRDAFPETIGLWANHTA